MDKLDTLMNKIKKEVTARLDENDPHGTYNASNSYTTASKYRFKREMIGPPHFYLIGDDAIENLKPIFSGTDNVTVLFQEGLTYATLPAFAEEHVNQHGDSLIYLVCFVGIMDLIQIEDRPCSEVYTPVSRSVDDIMHCTYKSVSVRSCSSEELTDDFLGKVLDMKQMIYDIFSQGIIVIIPDIQLIDLKRYQKYLDKIHSEIFHHKIMREDSHILNENAMNLIADIRSLNSFIEREFLSTVDGKFPWLLSKRFSLRGVNREFLRAIPVENGHILLEKQLLHLVSRLMPLIDDYENPIKTIKRVYFVGDPRMKELKSVWPVQTGVELQLIIDGNLTPEMVAEKLKNEDRETLKDSLVVVCFSIKSKVTVHALEDCCDHDPCKYIMHKNDPKEVIKNDTVVMVEKILNGLKLYGISCTLVFSPVIPIHFYNYRKVVAERHSIITNHNPLSSLPGVRKSAKETYQMLDNASKTTQCLTGISHLYEYEIFDIPKILRMVDNGDGGFNACSNLVNGLALSDNMASEIVLGTFRLINKVRKKFTRITGDNLVPHEPHTSPLHRAASPQRFRREVRSPRRDRPESRYPLESSPSRHRIRSPQWNPQSPRRNQTDSSSRRSRSPASNERYLRVEPSDGRAGHSKPKFGQEENVKSPNRLRRSLTPSPTTSENMSEDSSFSASIQSSNYQRKDIDKAYDKHKKSFQLYLDQPSSHPAYKDWFSNLTPNKDSLRVYKLWAKKVQDIMNHEWQKKVVTCFVEKKPKERRFRSSSSSSDDRTSSRKSKKKKKKSKSSKDRHQSHKGYESHDTSNVPRPSTSNYLSSSTNKSKHVDSSVSSTSDASADSEGVDAMEIMKLLVQVRGKAGVVGETIPILSTRIQTATIRGVKVLATFSTDDLVLLQLVKTKLLQTSRENSDNFVEKMIIEETVSQLQKLIEMVNSFVENKESIFNMTILNNTTENMNMVDTMAYIKSLLTEYNRPNDEDDVLPIFVELVKLRGVLQKIITSKS